MPVCGTQRVTRRPGRPRRGVAVGKFGAKPVGSSGGAVGFGRLAGDASGRLGETGQPGADGRRVGRGAVECPAGPTVWRRRVGPARRAIARAGKHVAPAGPTTQTTRARPIKGPATFFTWGALGPGGGFVNLEWQIHFKGNPRNCTWGRNVITWAPGLAASVNGENIIRDNNLQSPVRDDTDH